MKNTINQTFCKKNFFYSADSEHYQDAVLTYIFYNYPEPEKKEADLSEIEIFSKYFTRLFLDDSVSDSTITSIDVETQKYDSDVNLIVHTNDGDHLVIIEDKTGSAIHRSVKKKKNSKDKNSKTTYYETQLEKYYYQFLHDTKYDKYFIEGRVHLFYYKNNYINASENIKLDEAKKGCEEILRAYFFDQTAKINDDIAMRKKNIADNKDKISDIKEKKTTQKRKIKIEELETTIKDLETEIQDLEKKHKEVASCIDTIESSTLEWKKLDIHWIHNTFVEFFKDAKPENLILRDYFESISFWEKEITAIEDDDYTIERISEDDLKWGVRSKLWNPVFSKMIKAALEETNYEPLETKVQTYNGKYWDMSIHSKDKKTCLITNSKVITNNSFSIRINLRSSKYKDIVPDEWEKNDGARAKEGKKIIDFIDKNCKIDKADHKRGNSEKNQLYSYTFYFENGEKPDYETLLKYWVKVLKVFAEKIDGIE